MVLRIQKIEHSGPFRFDVWFSDGRAGQVDLRGKLDGPIFEPLQDPQNFAEAYVDAELHTVAWPNGADLAPEYLYFLAFGEVEELQSQFRAWGYIE